MRDMHGTHLAGKHVYLKTYRKIIERYTWKGIKDDVLRYVRECVTCHHNKAYQIHPVGLLHPFPIPKKEWKSISMDFIICFPKVHGRYCIYVVVN
jgi:hypothetical protein